MVTYSSLRAAQLWLKSLSLVTSRCPEQITVKVKIDAWIVNAKRNMLRNE